MADNYTVKDSTGATVTFGSDDVGPGVQYARKKIVWGPDGTVNDVDNAANKRLPVNIAESIALAITNAALAVVGGGVEATALRVTLASDSTGKLAATQSGTWNIGTLTSITNVVHVDDNADSLTVDAPVGTPVFVRLSDGSAAIATLPVSIAATVTVAGAKTNNNAAPGATNVGTLPALANAAAPSWTEGNLVALSVDLTGQLRVTGAGGGTQYTEDAVAAADPIGTVPILIRKDTPATQVSADGDNVAQRGTNYGAAYVQVVTSAGAYVDTFGGGTQYDEDTVSAAADKITMAGVVRVDTAGTLVNADGDRTQLQVNAQGSLRVTTLDTISIIGSETGDNAASGSVLIIGGRASTAIPTAVSADGDVENFWLSRNGALNTIIRDSTGDSAMDDANNALRVNVVAGSAGGPSIIDNAGFTDGTTSIAPVGYIFDEVAGTALTENDAAAARIDSKRAQIFTLEDATTRGRRATVTINNALSIDLTTINGNTPDSGVGAATGSTIRVAAASDAHDAPITQNPLLVSGRASAAAPTDVSADGDNTRLWTLRSGALATVLTAAGALIGGDAANGLDVDVTRVTGTVTTQDTSSLVDNAAFTDATSRVLPVGFYFDDTLNTALTENDIAAPRINANRGVVSILEDGVTRARYATVTAANALKVDASGVAVPVTDNAGSLTVDAPVGTPVFVRLSDGAAALTTTAGRLAVDPSGVTSPVSIAATVTAAGAKTNNTAAPGATNVGILPAVATAAAPSYTEANQVALSTDLTGALRISGGGGGTQYAEDSVAADASTGTAMLAVRQDVPTIDQSASGDFATLKTDAFGNLKATTVEEATIRRLLEDISQSLQDLAASQEGLPPPSQSSRGAQLDTPVTVSSVANALGGCRTFKLISAATTNATVVKTSPGAVYGWHLAGTNAAARYVKLYDLARSPVVGTDIPKMTLIVPGAAAGTGNNLAPNIAINFTNGIAFATTTGIADTDSAAVAASDLGINILYY